MAGLGVEDIDAVITLNIDVLKIDRLMSKLRIEFLANSTVVKCVMRQTEVDGDPNNLTALQSAQEKSERASNTAMNSLVELRKEKGEELAAMLCKCTNAQRGNVHMATVAHFRVAMREHVVAKAEPIDKLQAHKRLVEGLMRVTRPSPEKMGRLQECIGYIDAALAEIDAEERELARLLADAEKDEKTAGAAFLSQFESGQQKESGCCVIL